MTDVKKMNIFRIHLENEFSVLREDTVLALDIIEQINKYFKAEKPDWLALFDNPEQNEGGYSRAQMLRSYISHRTRTIDYRVKLLQDFILNAENGRANIDGTRSAITPSDAISALQMIKTEKNYDLFEKGHYGRVFKLAENRLESLGS